MHSTRPDAANAVLRAGADLPGQVVDVVVLTTDNSLLDALREGSAAEHALWHAPTADAAVDLLVGGHCGILVADLGTLRSDASPLLDRLQAQFPELVLVASGRRDEEGSVASLLSSGRIYRFLHKPVSPARAGTFLSAATRRYNELRDIEPVALTAARSIARRPQWKSIAAAAFVAIAAAVGFFVWQSADESAASPTPAVSRARTEADQIAEQLGRAQIALASGRIAEPRGDNALEYFRAVLALQPDHPEALAGVDRVASVLQQRVIDAIEAGNSPQGAIALTALQRAKPDHAQLDALRTQLVALSRGTRRETAAAVAPAPAPSLLPTPNLDLVRARIATDQFIEPEDDGAQLYLRRARDAGEDESKLRIAATDLGARLLDRTAEAIAGSDETQARRWLAAAAALDREFGLGLPDLGSLTQQVEALAAAARDSAIEEQLAAAIRLRGRGQLIQPAGDNAYDLLIALRESHPDAEPVRAEQQRLAFALIESARTASVAGDIDLADMLVKRADTLVPGMTTTRSLQEQIAAGREQRSFEMNVIPARTLQRTREIAAEYPREAERNGIEGWVDVVFTIAPDGRTQDLTVTDAQPKDIFEEAAVNSVRQWRFEPVTRNGIAVAQRATLRVRFSLRD